MTRKRKRLSLAIVNHPGCYLNQKADVADLSGRLGGPPTTGLMTINLLSRSNARQIALYGFDFFASLSLSGRRASAQVPHDFAAERGLVEELLRRDPRFCLLSAPP
jgi:hypothetical protein